MTSASNTKTKSGPNIIAAGIDSLRAGDDFTNNWVIYNQLPRRLCCMR